MHMCPSHTPPEFQVWRKHPSQKREPEQDLALLLCPAPGGATARWECPGWYPAAPAAQNLGKARAAGQSPVHTGHLTWAQGWARPGSEATRSPRCDDVIRPRTCFPARTKLKYMGNQKENIWFKAEVGSAERPPWPCFTHFHV